MTKYIESISKISGTGIPFFLLNIIQMDIPFVMLNTAAVPTPFKSSKITFEYFDMPNLGTLIEETF